MILTTDLIAKLETNRNGFTKATLLALGIAWPPRKGWRKRLVGLVVSESAFEQAMQGRSVVLSPKKKRKNSKRVAKKKQQPQQPTKTKSARNFYKSWEWKELRYKALKRYGSKCACCGAESGQMVVDHIKPIRHFPELSLDIDNLQVLCNDCNMGKGSWDATDWRTLREELPEGAEDHITDIVRH